MSEHRFRWVVALTSVVVAVASFAAGLRLLDDGQPDPAPPSSAPSVSDTTPPGQSATTAPPTTATTGLLSSPAWVAIVASETSREYVDRAASSAADAGYPTGVLHSDDYPSLKAGLWVAYTGPYRDARAAAEAVDRLKTDGLAGAYVRCVGTKKDCASDADNGGD